MVFLNTFFLSKLWSFHPIRCPGLGSPPKAAKLGETWRSSSVEREPVSPQKEDRRVPVLLWVHRDNGPSTGEILSDHFSCAVYTLYNRTSSKNSGVHSVWQVSCKCKEYKLGNYTVWTIFHICSQCKGVERGAQTTLVNLYTKLWPELTLAGCWCSHYCTAVCVGNSVGKLHIFFSVLCALRLAAFWDLWKVNEDKNLHQHVWVHGPHWQQQQRETEIRWHFLVCTRKLKTLTMPRWLKIER